MDGCEESTRPAIHTPYKDFVIPPPPPGLWEKSQLGGTVLFIIDPQNDFHPGGALAIPTADEDARRISDLIKENMDCIDDIVVALDTHQRMHIAHGIYWQDSEERHPEPFTVITSEDILAGKWRPCVPSYMTSALEYCKKLEAMEKFKLTIWPEHCIKGTPGHCVTPPLMVALNEWAAHRQRSVRWLDKGENIFTEMYSALKAEVPTEDPRTHLNKQAITFLKKFSKILVCGQALSHCVACSTRDLLSMFTEGFDRVTVLSDCSSPVPGHQADAELFLAEMRAQGVRVCKVADVHLDRVAKPPACEPEPAQSPMQGNTPFASFAEDPAAEAPEPAAPPPPPPAPETPEPPPAQPLPEAPDAAPPAAPPEEEKP